LTIAVLAALLFGESIGFVGAVGVILGVFGLLLLEVFNMFSFHLSCMLHSVIHRNVPYCPCISLNVNLIIFGQLRKPSSIDYNMLMDQNSLVSN